MLTIDVPSADDDVRPSLACLQRLFLDAITAPDGIRAARRQNAPSRPLSDSSWLAGDSRLNDERLRVYQTGYYFRLLTGQGPHAKGGAFDYVVKGHMIGGFAALAYPARYGNSGVMTFIVNHDGVVYQRDLGPDTAAKARAITRFDPGPEWTATSPQ